MTRAELEALVRDGWRLTRDGSTATAMLAREDPEEPGEGWEILVLHTAGHGCRFTLNPLGSGLTERPGAVARQLAEALSAAERLLAGWNGELPTDPGDGMG